MSQCDSCLVDVRRRLGHVSNAIMYSTFFSGTAFVGPLYRGKLRIVDHFEGSTILFCPALRGEAKGHKHPGLCSKGVSFRGPSVAEYASCGIGGNGLCKLGTCSGTLGHFIDLTM